MKHTKMLMLLLVALCLGSRVNAAIEISQLRKLWQQKASLTEVKDRLGIPAEEMVTFDDAQLRYTDGETVYYLRFGKQHRVAEIMVRYGKRIQFELKYEAVRQLRRLSSLDEVAKVLGNPSSLLINETGEKWHYAAEQGNLELKTDPAKPTVPFSFHFAKSAKDQPNRVDADGLEKLVRGETQATQLELLFGKPNIVRMTDKEEEWSYTSAGTTLIVMLDKNGLLTDYRYRNITDKKG